MRLKFFADYIQKELGIIYSEPIYYQLQQRLEKTAEFLKINGPEELYNLAVASGINGKFKEYLLDIATNNETSFFRDPNLFNACAQYIVPQLKKDFSGSFNYRIWSAASSFGQEPYSIAILLTEARVADPSLPRCEIQATDVSDQALARARQGKYSKLEVNRGLSSDRLNRFFKPMGEQEWQVKPEISSMVEFSKRNLLDPFAIMGKFHLIFCRYVLIYQEAGKKKEIMTRLIQCLHPKGYLVIGGSESALGLSTDLVQLEHKGAVFYQRKGD